MRRSREAAYVVYLVDPGPNRAGILVLLQEVLCLRTEAAAEYLKEFPSLISFYETEGAARNLADRFRDFDAVAVVRPADQPLAPAPVEPVELDPTRRGIRLAILVLGIIQVPVALMWYGQGNTIGGTFGLFMAACAIWYYLVQRGK